MSPPTFLMPTPPQAMTVPEEANALSPGSVMFGAAFGILDLLLTVASREPCKAPRFGPRRVTVLK